MIKELEDLKIFSIPLNNFAKEVATIMLIKMALPLVFVLIIL
jgi:hypothetical protein